MTRKVNFKNITIFIITSIVTILVGMYDRICGGMRILEDLYFVVLSVVEQQPELAQMSLDQADTINAMSCSVSAIPLLALGMFILAVVVIMGMTCGALRCGT